LVLTNPKDELDYGGGSCFDVIGGGSGGGGSYQKASSLSPQNLVLSRGEGLPVRANIMGDSAGLLLVRDMWFDRFTHKAQCA